MTTLFLVKILAGAAAYFLLGFLWYSNLMFGPEWRRMVKNPAGRKKRPHPWAGHAATFVGMVVACTVMGILIVVTRVVGASDGALLGFVLGLAFTGTTMLSEAAYAGQPLGLFLINASYRVLGLALAGAILAPWR
jgi:hypothetical protein